LWAEDLEDALGRITYKLNRNQIVSYDRALMILIDAYRDTREKKNQRGEGWGDNPLSFGRPRDVDRGVGRAGAYGKRYKDKAEAALQNMTEKIFLVELPGVGKVSLSRLAKSISRVAIHSCDVGNYEPIHQEQRRIFEEVRKLKAEIDAEMRKEQPVLAEKLDQAVELVARYHWLSCQIMEFERGSAGIADAMTKIMFDYLGIATTRWKDGIRPDLDAFTTDLDDFVKEYPDYFVHPPAFFSKLEPAGA
jgi:hypothetical protein